VGLRETAVPIDRPSGFTFKEGGLIRAIWPASGAVNEIPAMDGLRGVAILLVLMVHSSYELSTQSSDSSLTKVLNRTGAFWGLGGTGVHLFFVLSGFLLFIPYAKAAIERRPFPDSRRFFVRRALRILPAYWISLIVLTILAVSVQGVWYGWGDILLHVGLVHNVSQETRGTIDGPYWTLAVESQFYVMIPLIGWLVYRLYQRRQWRYLTCVAVGIGLAGVFAGLLNIFIQRHVPALSSHRGAWEVIGFLPTFGCGIVCSFLFLLYRRCIAGTTGDRAVMYFKAAGLFGIAIIGSHTVLVAAGFSLGKIDYFFFAPMMGMAYAGILLGTFGWRLWNVVLSSAPMRFVGGISYSVYLWHYPIYQDVLIPFAVRHGGGVGQWLLVVLGTLIVILPVCLLSYHLFEKPFIRARQVRH